MYGIFPYIYHKNQPNVGKYTIHGWYGLWFKGQKTTKSTHPKTENLTDIASEQICGGKNFFQQTFLKLNVII